MRNVTEEHARKRGKAMQKAGYAARTGAIDRSQCSKCGALSSEAKIEMHHEDYDKPLDVMVLCKRCHMDRHREKGTYKFVKHNPPEIRAKLKTRTVRWNFSDDLHAAIKSFAIANKTTMQQAVIDALQGALTRGEI